MTQTAAHSVDHVIPPVPMRQWVLSLPIPPRLLLLAALPELVAPVLQVVHRAITHHLLGQAGSRLPRPEPQQAKRAATRRLVLHSFAPASHACDGR